MSETFEKRVRAAAIAGWWVVLIGYAFLTVVWFVYLAVISARPSFLLTLWGQGEITWEFVQTVAFWFVGAFKLCIWLLMLVALWLTLWARQLRKMDRS